MTANRIAIVTGAARGIGASIALRLAADGLDVAVLDLNEDAGSDTVAAIRTAGRRSISIGADVACEEDVKLAVRRVTDELGPPAVLVNNAGILRDRTIGKMTLHEWELVLGVNLRGPFLMCREVQPHMRALGWGRIVNLSSIAALGAIGEANYSAAKAGVQGFTRTLAMELGRHGVTANCVAPGFIETPMTSAVAARVGIPFEDMKDENARQTAVGRIGQPEDVAQAVSFFVDPRSGFVTGQTLYVAGGPRG
jgi:3-oxoacyl-[acyl-carrier protein] reductase